MYESLMDIIYCSLFTQVDAQIMNLVIILLNMLTKSQSYWCRDDSLLACFLTIFVVILLLYFVADLLFSPCEFMAFLVNFYRKRHHTAFYWRECHAILVCLVMLSVLIYLLLPFRWKFVAVLPVVLALPSSFNFFCVCVACVRGLVWSLWLEIPVKATKVTDGVWKLNYSGFEILLYIGNDETA